MRAPPLLLSLCLLLPSLASSRDLLWDKEAEQGTWEGCGSGVVTKGKRTTVCLLVSELQSWNGTKGGSFETDGTYVPVMKDPFYQRFVFEPKVDEFTKLDIQHGESEHRTQQSQARHSVSRSLSDCLIAIF